MYIYVFVCHAMNKKYNKFVMSHDCFFAVCCYGYVCTYVYIYIYM